MTAEKRVNKLEARLEGALQPIAPRREFVRGLGSRLRGLRHTIRSAGTGTWQFILLALAGLLSLGLLLALVGRAIIGSLNIRQARSGDS